MSDHSPAVPNVDAGARSGTDPRVVLRPLAEASSDHPDALVAVEPFDPSEHTVAEVQDHLDAADDDERERVLAAEAAGKARKSILG